MDLARLERRIAALEANRGASLRFGTVTGVDAATGSARVQLADGGGMVSMPLRVLSRRVVKDQEQHLPDVGDPVAVLFSGQGLEEGVVLGAYHSAAQAAPGKAASVAYIRFGDGTEVSYDRDSHALSVKVASGTVTIEAGTSIELKAPAIRLTGLLTSTGYSGGAGQASFTGDVDVTGEVTAGTVELTAHTHGGVERGSGSTDSPNG